MTDALTDPACSQAPPPIPFRPRRGPQPAGWLDELSELAHTPWLLRVGSRSLLIRPTRARDLAAVAAMHARCSPETLLDRYRRGGRPPAVIALDNQVREPLSFAAATGDGTIVATALALADPRHDAGTAEVGVLVEDAWQGRGLARELATHLAGAACVAGYAQLVAYPGPNILAPQRLMTAVGRTWRVGSHLHTWLPEGAGLGLGAVRERLVG